ncbi:MAG: type II toxin-antitoxin system RelE/ParE family toxin [Bacteroidota bacterium]
MFMRFASSLLKILLDLHKFFADKIFSSIEILKDFPESGRIIPEYENKQIREIILGNYSIIYRFADNETNILTVYHSARLLG